MSFSPKDIYKGRKKWQRPLRILLTVLFILLAVTIALFYFLKQFVVPTEDGVKLEFPFFTAHSTPAPEPSTAAETGSSSASDQAASAESADAAAVPPVINAIYVPSASVTADGLAVYAAALSQAQGNALVLSMKPESGQLSWLSSVPAAASYDTNGTFDISETVRNLKEKDIYLIAELSCCTDELLAVRNAPIALKNADGAPYTDGSGARLDPGSSFLLEYLQSLIQELADLGFDEVLLKNLSYPDASDVRNPDGSAVNAQDTISALAESLAKTKADVLISAEISTSAVRDSSGNQTGQSLDTFSTQFSRLYCHTDSANYDTDMAAFSVVIPEQQRSARLVPITNYALESGSYCLLQ